MSYYRCGADKGQCERARTSEIQSGSEWICPSNNANCLALREEVSWVSVHKRNLVIGAVALLGVIVVWVLCLALRTDPLAKELGSLQAQAHSLDSRLSGLEGSPPNASVLVQARKLANDYQALETSSEGLRDRAATDGRPNVAAESDSFIEHLRDGHRRAARLAKPRETPVPQSPLPFDPKDATLKILATSDLAEKLVLPLLRAKDKGETVGPMDGRWFYTAGSQKVLVQSTDSPFQNLIRGESDLLFTDALPSAEESSAFTHAYPNATLDSRAYADVIGLDAITFSTDPGSPLAVIAPSDLTNGAPHMGGAPGTPERSAADRFGIPVTEETTQRQRPADAVLGQPGKLAIGVFHNEGANIKAQRLAFQASPQARALKPSPFTIATEDYKYAFRIYAFNRPQASPGAGDLVRFATSDKGQSVVSDQGFVDLRLRGEEAPVPPLVTATLGATLGVKTIRSATRLSTNFRYDSGSNKFDIKALADLERVPSELAKEHPSDKVVILGFTDNTGGPKINGPLSQRRAEGVAAELSKAGIQAKTAGLGDQLPVDTNSTDEGKARNRRSEIWVVALPSKVDEL